MMFCGFLRILVKSWCGEFFKMNQKMALYNINLQCPYTPVFPRLRRGKTEIRLRLKKCNIAN